MKFSLASSLLVPLAVLLPTATTAQGDAGVPDEFKPKDGKKHPPGCYFAEYFGSGTTLDESGTVDFFVAPKAKTYCTTVCLSGRTATTLYLNYGGAAAGDSSDTEYDSTTSSVCGMSLDFKSYDAQTKLGWKIQAADYDHLVLSCFCTDDGTIDYADVADTVVDVGGSVLYSIYKHGCFSESMVVSVQGKGDVPMKELQVGDLVLTSDNHKYEPVYSFGHYTPDKTMEFVQIEYTTTSGTGAAEEQDGNKQTLELTDNHMIMVLDDSNVARATRADKVQVGDRLWKVGGATKEVATVTTITIDEKRGLYMPLTPSGQIVVNGVLASNYVSISDTVPSVVSTAQWFLPFATEQTLSHWFLSPYRMLCLGISSSFCDVQQGNGGNKDQSTVSEDDKDDEGIITWLMIGHKMAELAELLPALVQAVVIGVPMFAIFAFFNIVETVFLGPAMAPCLFLLTAVLVAMVKKRQQNYGKAGNGELKLPLLG
ncbi:Desert hedgehog protein [Seminavis robusta]|uniref:Desert hedgehog protein n=1 Tax=Seminavis robusta TaxID=568900 RepID=A0A9N8EKX5_9STRA|nr:Desert hedgehog protein [Seminavis robusta]|eukprot:Sro1098_g241020.1 Desert hedgehog protein (484) ;mRNA; f:29843-31294